MKVRHVAALFPGLALTLAIAAAAAGVHAAQNVVFAGPGLDRLTTAIILGICLRAAIPLAATYAPGIKFAAGVLLEIAVALLGFSISFDLLASAGGMLFAIVVGIVLCSILASYAICRLLGIGTRMALLVACGTSICGNSAISAVAPAIRATPEDVICAITFSAFLGFALMLALPLLAPAFGYDDRQYGILAGLTIYAVPQVLAATAPVSLAAVQIGTAVKLLRVLMLGPVVMVLSFVSTRLDPGSNVDPRAPFRASHIVPWFIAMFLVCALLRSTGGLPEAVLEGAAAVTRLLNVIAMSALGLSVEPRQILKTRFRLIVAVSASLTFLATLSLSAVSLNAIALPVHYMSE